MIDKVIQFDKGVTVYRKKADACVDAGDFEGALRFLFSARNIEPDNLDVICDIADCYTDMGLIELSNKFWYLFLNKAPKERCSVAYEELAINYFYLDNYWASSYYFHKKLDTDGFISKEGLSQEIIDFFSGETQKNESYKIVYPPERADFTAEKNKAKRAIAMGAFDEADKMLTKIPDFCLDEDCFGDMAICRFMNDNLDGAEQACRESIEMHGENVTAYCNLSTVYDLREDFEKSEYYYRKALSCRKGSKDESYKIATCAIEREDHEVVLSSVGEILKERPYDVTMRFFFGLAKANTGDFDGAIFQLKGAHLISPEDRIIKYYLDYILEMASGKGDYLNITPFKYVKTIPESVEKAWMKKVKTLIKQPEKIVSAIKKEKWMQILCMGMYSHDSEFMRDCVYLLSFSKSAFAKELMLSALLDAEGREELKRVILYILITDGFKERFGVVIGSFFIKVKPRRLLCEKDAKQGSLFLSAYALCMSKCLILDLSDMDKIGKASDKVYKKLKNKVTDSEVSNEELGAVILSECKFDKFSEDNFVMRMFSITKNKLKTLKELMDGGIDG